MQELHQDHTQTSFSRPLATPGWKDWSLSSKKPGLKKHLTEGFLKPWCHASGLGHHVRWSGVKSFHTQYSSSCVWTIKLDSARFGTGALPIRCQNIPFPSISCNQTLQHASKLPSNHCRRWQVLNSVLEGGYIPERLAPLWLAQPRFTLSDWKRICIDPMAWLVLSDVGISWSLLKHLCFFCLSRVAVLKHTAAFFFWAWEDHKFC